jgi:hypothetical protein
MSKKEWLLTPVGEAKWAHVHTPKPAFKDKNGTQKGEPKFQIDVVFSQDDPEWKSWASAVMAELKELPVQIEKTTGESMKKQSPIKRELDSDDKPTGRFYVTFKTGAEFKPGVFDKHGALIPEGVLIGNGSSVKVCYTKNKYEAFGGGLNFYLNAVQVLELVEFKQMSAQGYGFAVVEGSSPFSEAPQDPGNPDDLPF